VVLSQNASFKGFETHVFEAHLLIRQVAFLVYPIDICLEEVPEVLLLVFGFNGISDLFSFCVRVVLFKLLFIFIDLVLLLVQLLLNLVHIERIVINRLRRRVVALHLDPPAN
jgi:hypothetical protein